MAEVAQEIDVDIPVCEMGTVCSFCSLLTHRGNILATLLYLL